MYGSHFLIIAHMTYINLKHMRAGLARPCQLEFCSLDIAKATLPFYTCIHRIILTSYGKCRACLQKMMQAINSFL